MSHTVDSSIQRILVTGATGVVGPLVVQAMHRAGFCIRTFSADMAGPGVLPQGAEVMTGDVTDQDAVQSAMQGVDAVVHLAALLHIVNPPPEMCDKYERVNIGGTVTVVEAAIKAGVKRIVLFSTIAVYGASGGQVLSEMSPVHPDTIYAQTKLAAEQIVLNARGADGQPLGTVLRLGAVYGSRIKGNYERLIHVLARNRFIPIGPGHNRRTLVYDKDVGAAVILAVSHPAAAGRVFNVTDGQYHTLKEIIEAICLALGRQPPRLSLPAAPARVLAGLFETGCRFGGINPPVTKEMIDKYTEDIAVEGNLIRQELGFTPQYDMKTAWEETIREMRI